jgi:hypothetical protein
VLDFTPTPTPTPTPTETPTPEFAIGDNVRALQEIPVFNVPGGQLINTITAGTTGTLMLGPEMYNRNTMFVCDLPTTDGWLAVIRYNGRINMEVLP